MFILHLPYKNNELFMRKKALPNKKVGAVNQRPECMK